MKGGDVKETVYLKWNFWFVNMFGKWKESW